MVTNDILVNVANVVGQSVAAGEAFTDRPLLILRQLEGANLQVLLGLLLLLLK